MCIYLKTIFFSSVGSSFLWPWTGDRKIRCSCVCVCEWSKSVWVDMTVTSIAREYRTREWDFVGSRWDECCAETSFKVAIAVCALQPAAGKCHQ